MASTAKTVTSFMTDCSPLTQDARSTEHLTLKKLGKLPEDISQTISSTSTQHATLSIMAHPILTAASWSNGLGETLKILVALAKMLGVAMTSTTTTSTTSQPRKVATMIGRTTQSSHQYTQLRLCTPKTPGQQTMMTASAISSEKCTALALVTHNMLSSMHNACSGSQRSPKAYPSQTCSSLSPQCSHSKLLIKRGLSLRQPVQYPT